MTTQVATPSVAETPTGTHKWVYDFAEGARRMRDLLGGKGAGVAEMTRISDQTSRRRSSTARRSRRSTRHVSASWCESPWSGAGGSGLTSGSACAASTAAISESIRFFHDSGLDYVSCSPFRLPIARVAAAQAAIAAPR